MYKSASRFRTASLNCMTAACAGSPTAGERPDTATSPPTWTCRRVSMEGRRVRRARDVFDPSTEWVRPQYGGELDRRRVQRELEKLAAREGADFGDLGLDDVV